MFSIRRSQFIIEYADDATEYVNTVQDFANEVPAMSQDAITNAETRANLEKNWN
ncbi:hypothetical protein KEH51_02015 [[Brevibacterium] frigoritolerans]|uniref:Uncharacterized protein n=1 Tax=Peribacillus frigoritolerans TaxID=450367 RepID=A0A941J1Y7_9BACI|nr:hypothetical protein [Peribacillus frigoritolerans]